MARDKTSWGYPPPEIQNEIVGLLPILGGRCSQLATVSRAWQSIIEPLNFAEISLTVPRLADLDSQAILFRKRKRIHYIWFRVELKQYDCGQCANTDRDYWGLDNTDNQFIADAFESLFTTLSAWEPRGDLVLDISVYSPSDNQHWSKYLSFCSDTSRHGHEQGTALMDGPDHGWVDGQQNFNEPYPERYFMCPAIRVPNRAVSQKLARASLHLTMLSASFMADASYFFATRRDSWTWDKLTSLALTSRVLTDDADPSDINNMIRDAAAAALKMPRLDTMELWSGRRGVAMLFRYQRAQYGQPAIITVRGTSELTLGITITQAWDVVAHHHCHGKVVVQTSLIDPDGIRCHGDAIRQLGLSTEVVRLVSLRQILSEHRFRA